ncbi:MAG: hypothetical protein H8E38_07460 [SAR324 cluster bacterium]|nr:hypothetical protein [SAR324 cluster bacterium]MBL7034497.1 hypothetical protein [SAR324 cluster bacterium]
MKFLLRGFTGLLLLFAGGCSQERTYLYPMDGRLELQRICRAVSARNTNRFMVLLGKIYPLNNDGRTAPLEEISTSLEDAGYFCGPYRLRNAPCSVGKNRRIDQSACSYLR